MRTAETTNTRDLDHGSTSSATDHAAVGLLVALGVRFLEADKLDHAETALHRAVRIVEAGGHASFCDTVMLHQHLAKIERRRQE